VEHAGEPVRAHADGGHHVQPEQRQVGEVVLGERLRLEVGVHQAQPAEADLAGAGAADVGQLQLVGVADDDPLHVALAVQQHADLAVDLPRQLGEVAGQLRADDVVRADAAAVGVPQPLQLAVLEAEGVSVDVVQGRRVIGGGLRSTGEPGPVIQCGR